MKREIFKEFKILLPESVKMRYTQHRKGQYDLYKEGKFAYEGTYLLEQKLGVYERIHG